MIQNKPQIKILAIGIFAACLFLLISCQSPKDYRQQADDVASAIITEGQNKALGKTEPFTIETAADTLRRRLMLEQKLPRIALASIGSDKLTPIKHWPKDDYLQTARTDTKPIIAVAGPKPLQITLIEALQIGARNSRDYQQRKELVFQAALALDLERDDFRNSFAGAIAMSLNHDIESSVIGTNTEPDASISRTLKSGASISSGIALDLVRLLTHDESSSLGIVTDISISIPLLAGSGKHIITENLTQAQHNILYELWNFERHKQSYAVQIASQYFSVLTSLDQIDNAKNNLDDLEKSAERARDHAEAGRLSEIDKDRANQDVLRGRERWINAIASYESNLDRFKIHIGLPADANIQISRDELITLSNEAKTSIAVDQTTNSDDVQSIAGPFEIDPRDGITIALEHRLDMKKSLMTVEDAQRGVVIAADALRAGLNLTGNASMGNSRSTGSANEPNAKLRPEQGQYSLGLDFDLPWDKTEERNRYRNSLIQLEQAIRSVQSLEDNIKLDIRSNLRELQRTRQNYMIQTEAVQLAEQRVEREDIMVSEGRAENRDLLDALEDRTNAQNALTQSLVSYRMAELNLQRDMGVLEVNEKGLWKEYNVTQ